MQEGKVYRVADWLSHVETVREHGWLWLLVDPNPDRYDTDIGLFRSVATGVEKRIYVKVVKELSDARG